MSYCCYERTYYRFGQSVRTQGCSGPMRQRGQVRAGQERCAIVSFLLSVVSLVPLIRSGRLLRQLVCYKDVDNLWCLPHQTIPIHILPHSSSRSHPLHTSPAITWIPSPPSSPPPPSRMS
ncbi:hypothetical protein JAAARDRAFT_639664 [Jaapia argillacea MUCL 33604]|uniref:Uncharacterized protein n=1 Tax=Jaapia argillacea MUCL 33604 TaxID=933084 RepID=A0A067PGH5_9AGAM|nr:hypothetical protein JAAARDRAFT_639664 [Jaapia argillacea MUCL 33604]